MASTSSTTMIEHPFALEWEISENRLKALKDSTKNECLTSDIFTVVHAKNLQCFLRIYPNGTSDENRGKTFIFLRVNLGNEKKIEAEYMFSIKSVNWEHKFNHVFDKSSGWGNTCCTVDELFDSNNKFIVDGRFTVKVNGILKTENAKSKEEKESFQPKWDMTKKLYDLRNIGYEDFTIVADGKEIKVHKNFLASHSTVFDAMFSNTKFKEGTENRVETPDFSFEIVEKVIELCYQQKNVSDFSFEENAMLLKFADKYDIAMVKENIETYLTEKVAVSNVCEMVKIAEEGNALKLQQNCLDFFTGCLSKKEFVPNMELLDKEFLVAAVENSLYQKFRTL